MQYSKSSRWCFTLNNPTELLDPETWPENVVYVIYQEETGANGTNHFQGYIHCKRQIRMSALLDPNQFPGLEGAHFEIARGNAAQCIAYCSKKDATYIDGPYEYGTRPGPQGTRTDLISFKDSIKKGDNDASLLETHTNAFFRFHKMVPVVRAITCPPRSTMTKVYVLYGPTAVGKSHWVQSKSPNAFWLARSNGSNNWFDGLQPKQDLVLDDFYGWIPWDLLLRMCDKYPLQVEIKGGSIQFTAPRIFITSNKHPRLWYNTEKLHVAFETFGRRVYSWMEWTGYMTYTKRKTIPPVPFTKASSGPSRDPDANDIITIE